MENNDSYLSIQTSSTGTFRDRGSKFLAFAYPVQSAEQVNDILEQLRREYHDARHHCYAYRLGVDKKTFRASDDGEPSNSAGKPILGQIQAFELSNILIVVVRYFGGTLLGVGGLIHAYRSAAAEAIKSAEIIRKTVDLELSICFPYSHMKRVMKVLDEEGAEILKRDFREACTLYVAIRKSHAERVRNRLGKSNQVKVFNSY